MDENDISWEPMDIDVSNNSAMDISYNEPEKIESTTPDADTSENTNIVPLVNNHCLLRQTVETASDSSLPLINDCIEQKTVRKHCIKLVNAKRQTYSQLNFLLLFIFIVGISWLAYQIKNFKCSEELDIRNIKELLHSKIYGQENAIEAITEALESEASNKMLFLYGGTGVGKTYLVSLLLDKLWNSSNVYHYTMPSFASTFSSELLFGMTLCKTSVFIIDDLTWKDINISTLIKNVVVKSEHLGKNITVILIYNCDNATQDLDKNCDQSFYSQLEQSFNDVNALKKYIKFQPLNKDHLRKCIENEIKDKKIKIDVDNFIKIFNVTLDGCKGVYTKMKILNKV